MTAGPPAISFPPSISAILEWREGGGWLSTGNRVVILHNGGKKSRLLSINYPATPYIRASSIVVDLFPNRSSTRNTFATIFQFPCKRVKRPIPFILLISSHRYTGIYLRSLYSGQIFGELKFFLQQPLKN